MSTTYTRTEAARKLGCSLRTLDRRIPPGTPGRTGGTTPGTRLRPGVRIDKKLIEALLPTPGGHDDE